MPIACRSSPKDHAGRRSQNRGGKERSTGSGWQGRRACRKAGVGEKQACESHLERGVCPSLCCPQARRCLLVLLCARPGACPFVPMAALSVRLKRLREQQADSGSQKHGQRYLGRRAGRCLLPSVDHSGLFPICSALTGGLPDSDHERSLPSHGLLRSGLTCLSRGGSGCFQDWLTRSSSHPATGAAVGSQTWNALPPARQLSAQIRPWCKATNWRQTARPSPRLCVSSVTGVSTR